jgi:hypothetical protein
VTKPKARRLPKISFAEFAERHSTEVEQVFKLLFSTPSHTTMNNLTAALLGPRRTPLPSGMQAFQSTPYFRLLSAAGSENCPEAFFDILFFGLRRMGVRIPNGILCRPRGRPGRPRSADSVFRTWLELGKPGLNKTKLAHAVYGTVFKNASSADQKRLIDRRRKAVSSRLKLHGKNLI